LTRFQDVYHQIFDVQHDTLTYIAVVGSAGSGKLETAKRWASEHKTQDTLFISNGKKLVNGYFAGFYLLFLHILKDAETSHPQIIQHHEQVLKRLFPFVTCSAYQKPLDLTNTSTSDERTRFYHHEYQEKLLNGVYEFFLEYCQETKHTFLLIIDNAEDVSPTVLSFLRIIARRKKLSAYMHVVLLCDQAVNLALAEHCYILPFEPLILAEATDLVHSSERFAELSPKQIKQYWLLSQGNCAKLLTLLECHLAGLNQPDYLSCETYLDFYLNLRGETFRYQLLKEYIEQHCISDDPLTIRNYENFRRDIKSTIHQQQIEKLNKENTGEQYMRLIHYTSLETPVEQLMALAPIVIKLQEIGLYDTWFDMFSRYYNEVDLRTLPDGEQVYNMVFIRMAFILYSLGLAKLSIPYLEVFYHHFPESLFTPTVLYSQSMTYGRYQIPVDLEKAEHYALLNLKKIDTIFKDHPKHMYIKVFAENALAYIRARQGRFEEALQLCTEGLAKMSGIYGDAKYALHQSILVYNTGQVHELVGDFDKAYETYKQAIALDPYYGEYYNDLANLLQKYHHDEEALQCYQQAIDLCPPYYEAHLNRANLYKERNEFEKAEADYLRVIELKLDEARAYLGLGIIYFIWGRYDDALSMLALAIYHNPHDAQAYNNRALVYMEYGKDTEAEENLNMAIRFAPKLSEAWNNRGILYFKNERYEESRADFTKAINLNPDPDYFSNRGILLQELNQHREAIQDFTYAREHGQLTEEAEERMQKAQAALVD
jgi:tetratricopeptide (TPR) repeat protein